MSHDVIEDTLNTSLGAELPFQLLGAVVIRGCCVFTWQEWWDRLGKSVERTAHVGPHHCGACIATLERMTPPVRLIGQGAERGTLSDRSGQS
jgi:hypothetical protein